MKQRLHPCSSIILASTLALTAASPALATDFVIDNRDGPGEGFNDPAPLAVAGGNPGSTLGQARYFALERALFLVGCHLRTEVPIEVVARFDPLTCDSAGATLASSGAASASRSFPNAALLDTYYPIALANAIAGVDLDAQTADVNMTFTSSLGSPGCLAGTLWYYGLDGIAPAGQIDFVSVAMHEFMHGIGFQTYANLTTGEKFGGKNDSYLVNVLELGADPSEYADMTNTQRVSASVSEPSLVWSGAAAGAQAGGAARLYAPNPLKLGSSVSHFGSGQAPRQLMEPFYAGPNHDPGWALFALADVGWSIQTQCPRPAPAAPPRALALLSASLCAAAVTALLRRSKRA
jgi:hypothetical protein